jgi:hypothetical protein
MLGDLRVGQVVVDLLAGRDAECLQFQRLFSSALSSDRSPRASCVHFRWWFEATRDIGVARTHLGGRGDAADEERGSAGGDLGEHLYRQEVCNAVTSMHTYYSTCH